MTTQIIIKNANFSANAVGFVPPVTIGLQQWYWFGGTALATTQDRSSNGLIATLNNNPTMNSGYVSFAGPNGPNGNQFMTTPVMDMGTSLTLLSVARSNDTIADGQTSPKLWSTYGGDPNYQNYPNSLASSSKGIGMTAGSTNGLPQCTFFLHDYINSTGNSSGTLQVASSGNLSITPVTSFKMYAGVIAVGGSGVTYSFYDLTDGTYVTSFTPSPAVRIPNSSHPFRIGSDFTGAGGMADISFAASYNVALTTNQLNTVYTFVKNYLGNLYNISI